MRVEWKKKVRAIEKKKIALPAVALRTEEAETDAACQNSCRHHDSGQKQQGPRDRRHFNKAAVRIERTAHAPGKEGWPGHPPPERQPAPLATKIWPDIP